MNFQGYKKRYTDAIEKSFKFPQDRVNSNATPKQYFNEIKKYSQIKPRRAYSTKHRKYFLNSQKYEDGIIEELKNRKNLNLKDNFSFSRIKTPTFVSNLNIPHKIEIAHTLISKNNNKIEEVNTKLAKLLNLYSQSSLLL